MIGDIVNFYDRKWRILVALFRPKVDYLAAIKDSMKVNNM